MEKIKIGPSVVPYPMPVTLVGANVGGRANFLAVAWTARVNSEPPLIGITLNKRHYTPGGIRENKTFSVNVPGVDLIEKTDYCGLVSGRNADKSGLFEVFYGELDTAPMIADCPICIECRLFDIVELPANLLILGEIVAAYTEEQFLTDGKPNIRKMNPFMLTMPGNDYLALGERVAEAWNVGKRLKQGGDE